MSLPALLQSRALSLSRSGAPWFLQSRALSPLRTRAFWVLCLCAALATPSAFAQTAPAVDASPSRVSSTGADDSSSSLDRLASLVEASDERQSERVSLRLEEALEIALSQAPTIALQEASIRIAEAQLDSTNRTYRPNISASAGIELSTGSGYVAGSTQLGGGQTRTTATSLNASLSAEQLIYDFGSHASRRRAARARVAAATASSEQTLQDIRTAVISQYLRAGAAHEQLQVARQIQQTEAKRAEQIEAYVEVGLRPSIDRATARANVASSTARFIDAETAYDLAVFELLDAMGVTDDVPLAIFWTQLDTNELEALDTEELRQLAQTQRGEFRQLAQTITAAEEGLRATTRSARPTLRGMAGVSESFLVGKNGRWNAYIGARIGWNIYQGGQVRFQQREQEAELMRLGAEEQLIVQTVVQEIRRAQRNIQGAAASVETRRILVLNAEEQLNLAQGRYETGLGNIVELSDAQLALTQAKFDEIEANLALSLARANLISSVAGWD